MNAKKLTKFLIVSFTVFLPLFFSCIKAQEYEDEAPVYTVILKSGEGYGDDVIIKSTDEGAISEGYSSYPGQFYNYDGVTYYKAPDPPPTFSSPTHKPYSFRSWDSEGTSYGYGEPVEIPQDTRSLALTAQWDDSWFELQTPEAIKIAKPGYTTFTCKLTDLHLGSYMEGFYAKNAENLTLRFQKGLLAQNGETLPYLVSSSESNAKDFAESQPFTEIDKDKEFQISIYISPEDFSNAKNGTYTGAVKYTGLYSYRSTPMLRSDVGNSTTTNKLFEGESLAIPIIMTIGSSEPEIPQNENQTPFPKTGEPTYIISLVLLLMASLSAVSLSMAIEKTALTQYKSNKL